MRIDVRAEFADVGRRLATLQSDIRDKATVRAVNRTVEGARTDMGREIRKEFNLKAEKVREKLTIRKAGFKGGTLRVEAALLSVTPGGRRSINIINFQARSTKAGLTAKIKKQGARTVVSKRGFIGNKGRTAFKRIGNARLPIAPLQTIDVPQMFNTRRINSAVVKRIRERFPVIVDREIRFYTAKFGRG